MENDIKPNNINPLLENKENTKSSEGQPQADLQENQVEVQNNPSRNSYSYCDDIFINGWFYFRAICMAVVLIFLIINSQYGLLMANHPVKSLKDFTYQHTKSLNSFFANHKSYKNALLISSSLCIDLNLIYMMVLWILKGKSWRLIISIILFYVSRGICQVIILLKS